MWFWYSVIALISWSGSDLFSKIGCADTRDRHAPLKMITAVGLVMGLHAAYEIFRVGVTVNATVLITYLPVSALYILSMAIGYFGLRYIELSISSPICNSSGAIVAVLCLAVGGIGETSLWQLLAVFAICAGVICLGVVEAGEDEALRLARQSEGGRRYAKSWIALVLPVIYCLLDALGTFADSLVLTKLDEDSANVAYELTFFVVGIVCFIICRCRKKKEKYDIKQSWSRLSGAVLETVGQFFYIYALADSRHVALSAPIISSYCAVSVLWGRIFLKEKLSKKHYACILLTVAGIVILGAFDA